MKFTDTLLLILLAAIWGSSFIFMRATADVFGPTALIAVRSGVAALCVLPFLLMKKQRKEFIEHWQKLAIIGVISSALPFCMLAYASVYLTAGTVSILNAMTPVFTAWIAHLWLNDKMTKLQFIGLLISIVGLSILVWDKVSWDIKTWWPVLAGVTATLLYGIATNSMKHYLSDVSTLSKTAGGLFFAALFMLFWLPFFLPDFTQISGLHWFYAIILGVLCTAFAYAVFFILIKNIGPSRAASVTFLIPIFSFLWGYLLLDEIVTNRMWGATGVILLGMSLVLRILHFDKTA
ncbi:MAG TPA: DMT family transporter [Leucothrix sp.]|nr:DMT family transporter [Leucothrix sp.]